MAQADSRGYYRILGLTSSASPSQIKEAFRTIAKRLHPDLNRGIDTTAEFQRVNEAYSVLSDPEQRAAYDSGGQASGGSTSARSHTGGGQASVPDIEPYSCVDCGCVSPRLRHVKYTQVVSYLFGAHRTNIWGVFCEDCASRRLKKASLVTGAFGWLSAPGILFTAHALARNLSGGQQEAAINMEICARQAVYYALRGDRASARIAAADAIQFTTGFWWSQESENRAKEVSALMRKLQSDLA